MRLFGLDAWSLTLALLAVAALLALLYLRKRPARRRVVPALALWLGVEASGARRLAKTPLSLLLAFLIAALLLAALGDPRPAYETSDFALVIDRGIAMSARDVPGTRLAAAKRAAHARIEALRPGDRAQVVSFAAHATAHSALTDDSAALHAAVDRIKPSGQASDAKLAEALVRGRAVVLFASEPSLPAREFVRIGSSDHNVGITAFSARSYPLDRAHASALVSIANFGSSAERVTLRVRSDVLLYEQTFELPAHGALTRTLDDLPSQPLEATIEVADALPEDDRALATLTPRKARVRLVSPGERYLEAALLIDPQLSLQDEAYDLIIYDRTLPAEEPTVPALYLGAPRQGTYVARPYFEHLQATPLLAGLSLRDVNIARALRAPLGAGDRVLASSADGTPLLVEGRRRAPFLALTFSLADSDLALRAAFPVLVLRAVDQLLGAPGEAETQLAHAGPIAPHGESTPVTPAIAWYWPLLASLALLLLALEYVSFRRGWTR